MLERYVRRMARCYGPQHGGLDGRGHDVSDYESRLVEAAWRAAARFDARCPDRPQHERDTWVRTCVRNAARNMARDGRRAAVGAALYAASGTYQTCVEGSAQAEARAELAWLLRRPGAADVVAAITLSANMLEAARSLGVGRTTLHHRVASYRRCVSSDAAACSRKMVKQ